MITAVKKKLIRQSFYAYVVHEHHEMFIAKNRSLERPIKHILASNSVAREATVAELKDHDAYLSCRGLSAYRARYYLSFALNMFPDNRVTITAPNSFYLGAPWFMTDINVTESVAMLDQFPHHLWHIRRKDFP